MAEGVKDRNRIKKLISQVCSVENKYAKNVLLREDLVQTNSVIFDIGKSHVLMKR